jgi:hypothetical protein
MAAEFRRKVTTLVPVLAGLAIVKKAIYLCQGTITVSNKPGAGCVFVLNIPKNVLVLPSAKSTVHGKDSVQPRNGKTKAE